MADDQRPDPDALLARVQAEESRRRRGKLKIFFGAAPGVGKTYAMLEGARKLAKEGADVVVGYVEPHARPETQALTLGLEILPRRAVEYRGRPLLEFDLAAALARRPRTIVVDELPHTNAVDDSSSLTHAKRWQDIEALLAAGIDVYTTVNVQHLESLGDIVAKISGVIVRETVPDRVFEEADEVELVDLPPDDLIGRLREGKVYVPEQAARALERFFNKGNLIALRELALRKMAERVDRQMTDYRADQAIRATWPAAERLLVCVTPGPTSAQLVRAARRMAASLRAPWLAVHVETPRDARLPAADRERLAETLHLARRLGGEVLTLAGEDIAGEVIACAHERNVTKIIVGKTLQPRWRDLLRGSILYELARRCGDIDIYIISGDAAASRLPERHLEAKLDSRRYAAALAAVAICTLIGLVLRQLLPTIGVVNLSMIYLAGVVAVASWHGRGPSIVAALAGVLAFNFFFTQPYYTFVVRDTQLIFTLAAMLVTGLVVSTLTSRLAFQAELSRRRERQTAALEQLLRSLVEVDDLPGLVRARDQLEHLLGGEVFVLVGPLGSVEPSPGEGAPVLTMVEVSPAALSPHERAVADWSFEHRESAGLGTDTLPSVSVLFVPLLLPTATCGVLGVRPAAPVARFPPEQMRLIEAAAGQIAITIARIRSAERARHAQLAFEREQLRSALLSAVSHDFRTPLAAIAGAGSTLAESGHALSEATRKELADSIVAESDRLNRLVANLLDMTRLEAGSMQLDRQWYSLAEIVGEVMRRLSRLLESKRVAIRLPDDLPMVYLDELLFHQVLANLLENAARYTPPGAEITLSAGYWPPSGLAADRKPDNGLLWIECADSGPGFPPGDETRIFEKFYRGVHERTRSGTGLGLAICRGIVELHGGAIRAGNRPQGGAQFRIELPQPPAPKLSLPAELAAS